MTLPASATTAGNRRQRRSRITGLPARTPLRVTLVATLVAVVALALLAAGLVATTQLRQYLVDRVDAQVVQTAQQFARVPNGGLPGGDDEPHGDDRRRLPSELYVAFVDSDGFVLGTLSSPLPEQDTPDLSVFTAQGQHLDSPVTVQGSDGGEWRAFASYRRDGTRVVVAQDLHDVNSTVGRLGFIELVIGLIVIAALAVLGSFLVRRSLRPLNEVERTAAAIAAGDLSRRVPDRDPRTEVGRLSVALNGMLAQIEHAFEEQSASETAARRSESQMRQLVADASHELRTPLTSIRGFAELYRQGAVQDDESLTRVMGRIEGEATRMGLLVEDLLLLARLDARRPLERRPVDLAALARDAVHDAAAVQPERSITLEPADHPVVVIGDDSRLRQVLANLLSNALHHTPEAAAVTVTATTREDGAGAWAVLEVRDEGPGLSAEYAEHVFERFFRAERSRNRETGGSGLGLSIVAGIAEAHGGRTELETAPGHGATFRVLLPLANASTLETSPSAAAAQGAP
ncbi:MAG: sensor histidine kinase, partial [Actinomycetales bacterium]